MNSQYRSEFLAKIEEHNDYFRNEDEPEWIIDLQDLPEVGDDMFEEINEEIINHINDYYNLIFVNQRNPLSEYGEYCYEVYFKSLDNVFHIDDKVHYGANIYVFDKLNTPTLKLIE